MIKKVLFLTGTRADFGKLKSLIQICEDAEAIDVHVFVTGMHMRKQYGYTCDEVRKEGYKNIFYYINHDDIQHMDRTLAKTIDGLSHYLTENDIDLIVVHGDRVEALAGAITGSLNNILVAHIEGGELSGTIDELIRHSISKMSHIHFVANEEAQRRLIQLGEIEESISIIGSPDIDLMRSESLPTIDQVKQRYDIDFESYAIAMYHPVTTEYDNARANAKAFVNALIASGKQYVVIYPNNDLGSVEIIEEYQRLKEDANFLMYPSVRFEYFLTLLKNAQFIAGNSSAGIREAPYYQVPTLNIGSRQANRSDSPSIINCDYEQALIIDALDSIEQFEFASDATEYDEFGTGESAKKFFEFICSDKITLINKQKQFKDIVYD